MQETQEMGVQSLAQEDLLEEEMATYFSILAWRISCAEDIGRTMVHGIAEESDTIEQDPTLACRHSPALCRLSWNRETRK